jgi:hypothetical protein
MTEKTRINPALIAALDHYASARFDPEEPSFFVFRGKDGNQQSWPLERTCGVAYEVLANEELSYLKLKHLKQGLKEMGAGSLYERIMGEKLEG